MCQWPCFANFGGILEPRIRFGADIKNKYCKTKHPNEIVWKTGAGFQVWKKMLQARDLAEHQIYWRIRNVSSNIWFDNWTR